MNLRDLNLRMVLLKAFAEAIDEELARARAAHRDELVARYKEEGTKSFDVMLPEGGKVAAVTLSIPKPVTEVTDPDALHEWAKANAPELLDTLDIPAMPEHTVVVPFQPARTERVVNTKRVTELIARVKPVDSTTVGPVVDPDTGQVIDGITHRPAADPKSFSVKFTDDGREELGRAYRAGALNSLITDTPLPITEVTQ